MKKHPRTSMPPVVYDNQHGAARLVRSWRDNLLKESSGLPLLLIVGGKVLIAEDLFTNIAHAIDALPRTPTTIITEPVEESR